MKPEDPVPAAIAGRAMATHTPMMHGRKTRANIGLSSNHPSNLYLHLHQLPTGGPIFREIKYGKSDRTNPAYDQRREV